MHLSSCSAPWRGPENLLEGEGPWEQTQSPSSPSQGPSLGANLAKNLLDPQGTAEAWDSPADPSQHLWTTELWYE